MPNKTRVTDNVKSRLREKLLAFFKDGEMGEQPHDYIVRSLSWEADGRPTVREILSYTPVQNKAEPISITFIV